MHSDPHHVAHHLSRHLGELGVDPAVKPDLVEVVKAQRERSKTLLEMAQNSLFFYQEFESYDAKAAKKNLKPAILEPLTALRQALAELPQWEATSIHSAIIETAEKQELKMGKLAQPLRVAVTGGAISPPIDITLELIGSARTLDRIDRALELIRQRSPE